MQNNFCVFTVLLLCFIQTSAFAQVQLGMNINGAEIEDLLGFSVASSADGNRIATGAPGSDENGDGAGLVRCYDWNGSEWVQIGEELTGTAADESFGYQTSMSDDGNRLAVSAISSNLGTAFSGRVEVFEWNGSNWIQLGESISGSTANDQSGRSLAVSADGNSLVIGSTNFTTNQSNSGQARVFRWINNQWQQLGSDIEGVNAEQLGSSVAISAAGTRVALGARFNNNNGGNSGKVSIYEWNGTSWIQLGADIDGETFGDQIGWSVSLSANGNRIATGTPLNDDNGMNAGHVRVFDWNGSNWNQIGNDIDGEGEDDKSGFSVSLTADGNRLAIGSEGSSANDGKVKLFDWNGTEWAQIGTTIEGGALGIQAINSVQLSADGNRIVVGAPFANENGTASGQVKVYGFLPSNESEIQLSTIDVFPNPVTTRINFSGLEVERARIFNQTGQLIVEVHSPAGSLDLSSLPAANYVLQVFSENQVYTIKITKQ